MIRIEKEEKRPEGPATQTRAWNSGSGARHPGRRPARAKKSQSCEVWSIFLVGQPDMDPIQGLSSGS